MDAWKLRDELNALNTKELLDEEHIVAAVNSIKEKHGFSSTNEVLLMPYQVTTFILGMSAALAILKSKEGTGRMDEVSTDIQQELRQLYASIPEHPGSPYFIPDLGCTRPIIKVATNNEYPTSEAYVDSSFQESIKQFEKETGFHVSEIEDSTAGKGLSTWPTPEHLLMPENVNVDTPSEESGSIPVVHTEGDKNIFNTIRFIEKYGCIPEGIRKVTRDNPEAMKEFEVPRDANTHDVNLPYADE